MHTLTNICAHTIRLSNTRRRDAAEREAQEEAAAERERLRNMTEEERLVWLKANRPQVC
jgi:hypothetical protein